MEANDSLQERLSAIANLKSQLEANREDQKPAKKTFKKEEPVRPTKPEPTSTPDPPKKIEDLPKSEDPNLLTKAEAIKKILKLQELTGLIDGQKKKWTPTALDNMRKDKVIETLGGFMNAGAAKLTTPPEVPTYQVVNDETGKPTGLFPVKKPKIDREIGARTLYNINYSAVKFLEFVSVNMGTREKLGSDFEGLGKSVDEDRDALLECMKEIWDEHGVEMEKYLSAVNKIAFFMTIHMGSTLMANYGKKPGAPQVFTGGFVHSPPPTQPSPPVSPPTTVSPISVTEPGSSLVSSIIA